MKAYLWVLIILISIVLFYVLLRPQPVEAKKEIIYTTYDAIISGGMPATVHGDAPIPGDKSADVLLKHLKAKDGQEQIGHIDSQKCYEIDFISANNRTGNYSQKTNNYKHVYPDSCSGTRQEIIGQFYQM